MQTLLALAALVIICQGLLLAIVLAVRLSPDQLFKLAKRIAKLLERRFTKVPACLEGRGKN